MTQCRGQDLVSVGADQRQAGRFTAWITRAVAARDGEAEGAGVTLLDLSTTGCRMSSPVEYRADERIWLRFQSSPMIPAKVVWCRYGHVGCVFDAPIPAAFVRALTLTHF